MSTRFCRKWVEVMQISDRPAVETRRSVYGGVALAGPRVTSSPVWPKFFRLVHTHTPRLWCSHPFSTFFRPRLYKKLAMDGCDIKLSHCLTIFHSKEFKLKCDANTWFGLKVSDAKIIAEIYLLIVGCNKAWDENWWCWHTACLEVARRGQVSSWQ